MRPVMSSPVAYSLPGMVVGGVCMGAVLSDLLRGGITLQQNQYLAAAFWLCVKQLALITS
jgi:hypothetical protein